MGIERLEALNKIHNLPLEKIEYLHDKIVDNENLKNITFLKKFNKISSDFKLPELSTKDFDKKKDVDYDDFPF